MKAGAAEDAERRRVFSLTTDSDKSRAGGHGFVSTQTRR